MNAQPLSKAYFAKRAGRRLLAKRAVTAAFVAVLMMSLVAPTAAQTDYIALRRQAAEKGDVKSQLALGLIYANGLNVPQDYAEAAKWLRKAADQGNSQAQYELGLIYVKGQGGLPRDEAEAMRLFRSAADQGDPNAQRLLGTMADFQNNYDEAVRWYRKGADEGDPGSQEFLGILYKEGRGVPQDYVQAHKWFDLAATHFTDREGRKSAVENREWVASKMTAAQVAEAQRLAREWKPTAQRQ